MRKTKAHFGGMILLFLVLIFVGSLYYQDRNIDNDSYYSKFISYEQKEHNSCFINIVEPTIILRMDDIRAYSKLTMPLIDEILNRNISVTLGVIPRDLEKDENIIKYLKQIKTNPYIEIAQHGNYHNESDKNISDESLIEGYGKIQRVLGVLPATYILPYNEVSLESKEIISNYFKIISGEQGIIKEGRKIAEIGYTEETYNYNENKTMPLWKVIGECKTSLEKTNLCVVTIHPQEYAININNPIILSNKKFEEFKEMLDKLQELNASFKIFKDLVTCSEKISLD